jgi:hypothetical protein
VLQYRLTAVQETWSTFALHQSARQTGVCD